MQLDHSNTRALRRTRFAFAALAAASALTLGACSKGGTDVAAPTAAASVAAPVAVAPVPAPVPVAQAPAPTRTIVAQNESTAQQRRNEREYEHRKERDERAPPPRADRDGDYAPPPRRDDERVAAVACATCGVVESFDAVQVQGETNGVGAVAGGVGGALLGNRIAGSHNRTLGGVVGAVGGGLLGNAVEKHERASTAYDVHVRMSDGSTRTVRQATQPTVGMKVLVEADGLHARS